MAFYEVTGTTGVDAPSIDTNRSELVQGNKTLVAADTGKTFVVKRGTSIFTLPATAVGLVYTFAYIGDNAGGQIQVSPVAADGIAAERITAIEAQHLHRNLPRVTFSIEFCRFADAAT